MAYDVQTIFRHFPAFEIRIIIICMGTINEYVQPENTENITMIRLEKQDKWIWKTVTMI